MTETRWIRLVRPAGCRHQQHVAVIGNARAAEVRVTKAVDDRVGVVITRAAVPAGQTRVRAELDQPERNNRAGELVAVTACANKRIDLTSEVSLCVDLKREQKQ